jgi:hypothetical protein
MELIIQTNDNRQIDLTPEMLNAVLGEDKAVKIQQLFTVYPDTDIALDEAEIRRVLNYINPPFWQRIPLLKSIFN